MSLKSEMDALTAGLQTPPTVTTKRAASNISAPAALMAMNSGYKGLQDEVGRLRKDVGKPIRVRMDLCDDGPHHTTPLDPERVANLQANMKENGQSSPALLRLKPDGRYDIIAGRHRKAALLELGEEEWDGVLKDIDDDQAERLTFYDNLLAPTLTDYARFMGFARRKQTKGLTDQQLAEEAGVSRTTVVRLMSFQNLPKRALKAVSTMPTRVGLSVTGYFVIELVKLVPKYAERVDEAMEQVAAGALAVGDVLGWIENEPPAKPQRVRVEPRTIRLGKSTFAKVSRKEGRVVVEFADKDHAASLEKAIGDLIEEHSRKLTPKAEKASRK
jgi:ParB family chromosome partitioning protein